MDEDNNALLKACVRELQAQRAPIRYFDDLVRALPTLVSETPSEVVEYYTNRGQIRVNLSLEGLTFGDASRVQTDGSVKALFPCLARAQSCTYAVPMYTTMHVESVDDNSKHVSDRASDCFIGFFPIMVGSSLCRLAKLSQEERVEKGESFSDSGGYFIVNGHEKTVSWFRRSSQHATVCFESVSKSDANSKEYVYAVRSGSRFGRTISTSIRYTKDTGEVSLLFCGVGSARISPATALRCLGAPVERVRKLLLPVEVPFLGKDDPSIKRHNFSNLFPGTRDKACALISSVRDMAWRVNQRMFSPRDCLSNQTLEGVRESFEQLIKYLLRRLLRKVKTKVHQKIEKVMRARTDGGKHWEQTKTLPKAAFAAKQLVELSKLGNHLKSFLGTGNLITGNRFTSRSGAVVPVGRVSTLDTISTMTKITCGVDSQTKVSKARELELSGYGRICSTATPEGANVGLRVHGVVGARVSANRENEREIIEKCCETYSVRPNLMVAAVCCHAGVWVGSKFVCATKTPEALVEALRRSRQQGQVAADISVSYRHNTVDVRINAGRMLRVLRPVDKKGGVPPPFKSGTFSSYLDSGHVELVDILEEYDAFVANREGDIVKGKHTHVMPFASAWQSAVMATIPFVNHQPAPRTTYWSSMSKQTMGSNPDTLHPWKFQKKSTTAHYAQRPIVYTDFDKHLHNETSCASGLNLVVAVISNPYTQEDALVFNRAALERGAGRCVEMVTENITTADRKRKRFAKPPALARAQKGGKNDVGHLIDGWGLPRVGSQVPPGGILAGLQDDDTWDAANASVRGIRFESDKPGIVDSVHLYEDIGGFEAAKVKLRVDRPVCLGDKWANRHSQKGTVGRIEEQENMPFVRSTGMVVDCIFNPLGLPSRMTASYVCEGVGGLAGSQQGRFVNGSAGKHTVESLIADLEKHGFKRNSEMVTLVDGKTGQTMRGKYFVGVIHYSRLNKLASAKFKARCTGVIDEVTKQPAQGQRGKAQRYGEMEMDTAVSFGASEFLRDRLVHNSDGTMVEVCENCGNQWELHSGTCPRCKGTSIIKVQSTHAVKRLTDTMLSAGVAMLGIGKAKSTPGTPAPPEPAPPC